MVGTTGYFWNQVYEQLNEWYKEFSLTTIGERYFFISAPCDQNLVS